jgi:hypothetical protein
LSLDLEVQREPCLPEALELLTEIAGEDKYYAKALKYAEKAATYLETDKDEKALSELIKATDELKKSDGLDAPSIRVMLDQAIRNVSAVLYLTQ